MLTYRNQANHTQAQERKPLVAKSSQSALKVSTLRTIGQPDDPLKIPVRGQHHPFHRVEMTQEAASLSSLVALASAHDVPEVR